MTTRKQSLKTALRSAEIRRGLNQIVGCPAGGWAQTEQAFRGLHEYLPLRANRSYTVGQLTGAALVLDHADRYQWREGV